MIRLLALILGYTRVRFTSPRPERLLNAVHRMDLPLWDLRSSGGELSFRMLTARLNRLEPFQETLSLTEEINFEKRGLPALLYRYRKRFGFFAGIAVMIAATLFSDRLVWSVEVSGVTTEPEIVLSDLADAGLYPGRLSSSIDPDRLARVFLLLHPEYEYAGIRLVGMRALVELREAQIIDKKDPYEGLSNLVADGSGRVVRCESMAGEVLVKPGDLVRKGDLLISGIRSRENGVFSPVRARGRVFAETEDVFECFIPFRENKTVFTGREKKRVSFFILGRCFAAWGEPDPFDTAATQEFYEPLRFLGRDLPVFCCTVVFSEQVEKMTAVDVDRASNLAYDRYIMYKEEFTARDAVITAEEFTWEEREDGVFLRVGISLVRDLCREVPFSLVPPET